MSREPSIAVIRLAGELDVGRRDEVASALRVRGSEPGILVDLSDVTYADSTTLAELLRLRGESLQHGVPLALIITSRQFMRLFQHAGLSGIFEIFDSRASALRYLARTPAP